MYVCARSVYVLCILRELAPSTEYICFYTDNCRYWYIYKVLSSNSEYQYADVNIWGGGSLQWSQYVLHVCYHTEIICSPEARQATGGGPGGMVGHVRQTVSDPEEGGPGPVHRQETG